LKLKAAEVYGGAVERRQLTVHRLSAGSVAAEVTALGDARAVAVTTTLDHALDVRHGRSTAPADDRALAGFEC